MPTAAYLATLLALLVLLSATVLVRRRWARVQATIETGDPLTRFPKGS